MRTALLQITSSDDPVSNLATVSAMVAQAATAGAGFILTPEVTNVVTSNRAQRDKVVRAEADDITLTGLRAQAAGLGIWLSIGSLLIKTEEADGRVANRSYLIDPSGTIAAWYDKIHLFDVTVSPTETYRESAGVRPGNRAVTAQTPFGILGLTVCYDLRFPQLHRALAHAGAEIILQPAAFSTVTGAAHWEPLLRARAIETGCYVLAAAQTGLHPSSTGERRRTYGHSMAISPWGEVLLDAGTDPGISYVDLELKQVAQARARIPALDHDRPFEGP
jgi:deaminated glutathione amidase